MKVLVTGAAGQLGTDVVLHLEKLGDHDIVATDLGQLVSMDITNRAEVLAAFEAERPDAVIHCAAFTAVDLCEAEPDKALLLNAVAVRHVAEASARVGAHLVAVSTDYVFDGSKLDPYTEWDTPNPKSVYGSTKHAGEVEALRTAPLCAVARTSWVCGEYGPNMVKTILRLAGEHDTLTFVDDQRGHPTFTADLAPALVTLAVDRRPGLFHVTNAGAVSWFEFAQAVLEAAGLDPARVKPCATADLQPPRPAPRPANSVLDNVAWRQSGLPALRDFREPLAELVTRLTA